MGLSSPRPSVWRTPIRLLRKSHSGTCLETQVTTGQSRWQSAILWVQMLNKLTLLMAHCLAQGVYCRSRHRWNIQSWLRLGKESGRTSQTVRSQHLRTVQWLLDRTRRMLVSVAGMTIKRRQRVAYQFFLSQMWMKKILLKRKKCKTCCYRTLKHSREATHLATSFHKLDRRRKDQALAKSTFTTLITAITCWAS